MLLNLLFPKICNGCKNPLLKNEELLCASCRHHLPIVSHHLNRDDTMKNSFYGRIPVQNATALLQFQKKGLTQELLHNLKYRGNQQISFFFGKWLGAELANNPDYQSVEIVIPVPLHKQRLKKRGYNQVSGFGKEIANALKTEFREDVLVKISQTESQVFKDRMFRFSNANDTSVFSIRKSEAIKNKHILLVDDIMTTGATLENCALELLKTEGVSVSFATIAIA